MIKQKIINHILSNGGKLVEEETWLSIAQTYNLEAANIKRAQKDNRYKNKAIARQAQRYWESYIKQTNKLKVKKQIFENGRLKWETFKEGPQKPQLPENPDDFEIEKYTTNPYGGAWMKLKRKEKNT